MVKSISSSEIWVVIPGYNESKNISQVLTGVLKNTKNVVYVDDGSKDDSTSQALKYTPHVLTHVINLGKGAALKTGCEYVFNEMNGKAAIFLDADNQHNPGELPLFIRELKNGHPVIFGIRELNNKMPKKRVMANIFFSFLIYLLFGTYVTDITSGYKAINKNTFDKINWNTKKYSIETEFVVNIIKQKIPFKMVKVETIYNNANLGMNLLDIPHVIMDVIMMKLAK